MTLQQGARLGPFEIDARIGSGGMGDVYRAIDTNLKRAVAIKVLPASVATDAERLARFQREAELLAALNHPNIAAIYGLERSGDDVALVMELVEGQTLAARIAQGPLTVEEAVPVARQIADALEAAHEQGIVHRDLKPANIKIRTDGAVKVLDFGLAKALEGHAGRGEPSRDVRSQSPTLTSPALTQAGAILGTAGYMSPEQACGKPVDKRTDIWAFGCVLYEMLTGRRPFGGPTVTETLAAILERDVDWTPLPATVGRGVRTALRRTLEKDPKRRLHDIADARIEMDDAAEPDKTAEGSVTGWTSGRWMSAVVASSVVVGAVAWYVKPTQGTAPSQERVARLVVEPDAPLADRADGELALSPDGSRLAYVSETDRGQLLYLRSLDRFDSQPIPGTDGADGPAFSPDGRWVAFRAEGEIKKVAVEGGTPVSLCDSGTGHGLSWESNDALLFGRAAGGIWRVSAAGGPPSPVTTLVPGEFEHDFPEMLPGGRALLYVALAGGGPGSEMHVIVQTLETGERRQVASGAGPHYLSTGHLAYVAEGNLFALPFDLQRLEPRGRPALLVQGVRQNREFRTAQVAYSATGALAFMPAATDERQDSLVWVDSTGAESPTGFYASELAMPRLAPDLRRAAVASGADLWLYDLVRTSRRKLTFDGASTFPVWGPQSAKLAYRSARDGQAAVYVKSIDGTMPDERVSTNPDANIPLSWSPDGRFLAMVSVAPGTANDVWVQDLEAHSAASFVATPFPEGAPTISNDGRWIAYASEQSGRREIYMRPFPGPGQELTVSTDGGNEPLWARKAGRLFYRHDDAMMVVDITTSPTVSVGKPRELFEGPYERSDALWPDFDVTPDGERLLMVKSLATEGRSNIRIVLNWQDELQQLDGARGQAVP